MNISNYKYFLFLEFRSKKNIICHYECLRYFELPFFERTVYFLKGEMRCMNTFGLTIMITLQTSGTKEYLKNIYILWYYLLLLHVNAYAVAVHATQTTSKAAL